MKTHERPATFELKPCSQCHRELPLTEYYPKKRKNGVGLFAHCKECEAVKAKQRYLRNRRKVIARQKARQIEKRDEIAKYQAEWYEANRERVLAKQKAYNSKPEVKAREKERHAKRYRENREEIRARQNAKSQCPEYRARVNERSRQHYRQNKTHYIEKGAARRAARVQATPKWYKASDTKPFYDKARRLTKKTGIKHVVDHIVPLINPKVCGLHCKDNLQVITEEDNLRKFNKFKG